MAKIWGQVRQEILANFPFIQNALEKGQSRKTIFEKLSDEGKLTGSYPAFARQLNILIEQKNAGSQPESPTASGPIVLPFSSQKTDSATRRKKDSPESLPLFEAEKPTREKETVSSRRAQVVGLFHEDKAASDQRALDLISPVGKD